MHFQSSAFFSSMQTLLSYSPLSSIGDIRFAWQCCPNANTTAFRNIFHNWTYVLCIKDILSILHLMLPYSLLKNWISHLYHFQYLYCLKLVWLFVIIYLTNNGMILKMLRHNSSDEKSQDRFRLIFFDYYLCCA